MINDVDAQILSKELAIISTVTKNFIVFHIPKGNHEIRVELLKTGQYIFVTLIIDFIEYSIEHVEFYMGETKEEILIEVKQMIRLLSDYVTRYKSVSKGNKASVTLEILKDENWLLFGYTFGYPKAS